MNTMKKCHRWKFIPIQAYLKERKILNKQLNPKTAITGATTTNKT